MKTDRPKVLHPVCNQPMLTYVLDACRAVGVAVPASPKGLVAEAGSRVAYSLGLDQHLILQGYVEALCSLTSWTVYVNHVAVWTMPRFATVAGIDLAARF